ncbi:MAG: hypothetical protein ACPGLY_23505, partial [Rubripirellula sp.]
MPQTFDHAPSAFTLLGNIPGAGDKDTDGLLRIWHVKEAKTAGERQTSQAISARRWVKPNPTRHVGSAISRSVDASTHGKHENEASNAHKHQPVTGCVRLSTSDGRLAALP